MSRKHIHNFSCFILLFEIKQTVVMFPKMFPKKIF